MFSSSVASEHRPYHATTLILLLYHDNPTFLSNQLIQAFMVQTNFHSSGKQLVTPLIEPPLQATLLNPHRVYSWHVRHRQMTNICTARPLHHDSSTRRLRRVYRSWSTAIFSCELHCYL